MPAASPGKLAWKGGNAMKVRSFFLTMGAGVAVGALGAMMLPKNSEVYQATKKAAKAIEREAETVIDSLTVKKAKTAAPQTRCGAFLPCKRKNLWYTGENPQYPGLTEKQGAGSPVPCFCYAS